MTETDSFRPEERPIIAGSPFSPTHLGWRRLGYFVVGALLGASSTFGNALTTVNATSIAGSLGLYAAQTAAFPALYVAFNATGNLLLVKARTQFGIPEVTSGLVVLYALTGLGQFMVSGFAATLVMRAVCGLEAAAIITLSVYYLMEAFPAKAKPIGAVIALGLAQLGTPLARLIPVDVLVAHGLWGLHAFEVGLALATLGLTLLLPLPPSEKSRAFVPLDLVTILLAITGMVLLCQVINQGRTLWWTDTPWLGWALAAAVPLLVATVLIEQRRLHPLVHFEWIGTWGIMRFAAVALLVRLALAEQTYGAVGLLTLAGLNDDQMRLLFAVVAGAMLLAIGAAALTLSNRHLPWQILIAALIIAAGAWLDSGANALTRPAQLMWSQALIGFGTALFVGPALLYGFLQMIQRGGDYLVSFVVTYSITQNVGGLVGPALLGSLQIIWGRNAANVLTSAMAAGDPLAATRISSGAAAFGGILIDPSQRASQGAALVGQSVAHEAAVIAFTDTFWFVAMLALATALFVFVNIIIANYRRGLKL